jgi:hypothetical protein
MTKTEMQGRVEKVVEFWTGLGFAVTYDVMKEGYQCLCHNEGFGVDITWTLVRPPPPPHTFRFHARHTNDISQSKLYLGMEWQ